METNKKKAIRNAKIRRNILLGMAAAGGIALGYVAYSRWAKENKDVIIKAGQLMQRYEEKDGNPFDNFYAAIGRHDKKRYENFLPGNHLDPRVEKSFFKKILEAKTDIKIASPKNGRKIFENLKKTDKEFRDTMERNNYDYDRFNQYICAYRHNEFQTKMFNKFRKAATDAGYGGVIDVNDLKYSGYNAKKPVIVFDRNAARVKESVEQSKFRHYENGKLVDHFANAQKEAAKIAVEKSFTSEQAMTYYGYISATGGASAAATQAYISKNDKQNKQKKRQKKS